MRKVSVILFLMINLLCFSKKNYDETKFRQDMINWASSKVGAEYSMENRWGENTYDCSSLISRGLREIGMTSISGKKSDYGTTARGLYKNSGKKIEINDHGSLKPGDIVHNTIDFHKIEKIIFHKSTIDYCSCIDKGDIENRSIKQR